jgi:membrane protein YdbS with pleckstrin-like domain
LDTIALIVIAVGLGLAWYSFFAQKPFFHYLSYGIAIVTVLVHEGILWIWRIRRDRKIEEIEDLEDDSEEQ